MMNSQQGFGGKDTDIQNFLNIIKQKGDDDKFKDMIDRMSPTTKKVENFLGGQKMAHDYHDDPELIKTLQEIINTPGYDPASVREAQRQMIRINAGLPRFPKV